MSAVLGVIGGLAALAAAVILLLLPSRAHRLAAFRLLIGLAILLCGIELGLAFREHLVEAIIVLAIAGGMIVWASNRILLDAPPLSGKQDRWKFTALVLGVLSALAWTASSILQLA